MRRLGRYILFFVSLLVWAEYLSFLVVEFSFYSHIFWPIYRCVIPTFFSVYKLIKLRG